MGQSHFLVSLSLGIIFLLSITTSARLRLNYYAKVCPDVENIVRRAVEDKFRQTFVTVPAVIRLFFHDCFVSGCDASIIVASTPGNKAEKDHPDNLSLAGDGFDTVIKAKEAVDKVATCKNKVSCADILALATRDAIVLSGGPKYKVELGRLDGLKSMAQSVNLPQPDFNLTKLNTMFALKGLSQEDMIALSACHTIGFSHCNQFSNRIYSFNRQNPIDPTLNPHYAVQLRKMCPRKVDPAIVVNLDPTTPTTFDNAYFKNLVQGMGLFNSDQVLFTDTRSRSTVTTWASDNATLFNSAFITAITKLGRVGIKTKNSGNIRFDCAKFN